MKKHTQIVFAVLIVFGMSKMLSAQDTSAVGAQDTSVVKSAPKTKNVAAKNKIYYGGNIGLSFGNYTMIAIRPLIAYKITPKLSAGVRLSYEYVSDKRYSETYNTSNYGASVFTRYRIIPQIYAHAEFAALNYELYNELGESQREWLPFLLIGAGYSQRLGGNVYAFVEVLFDVLQSDKSPYRNWEPFTSIGIGVGF